MCWWILHTCRNLLLIVGGKQTQNPKVVFLHKPWLHDTFLAFHMLMIFTQKPNTYCTPDPKMFLQVSQFQTGISLFIFPIFTLKRCSSFREDFLGRRAFMAMKAATASLPSKLGVHLLVPNGPALLNSLRPQNLTVMLNLAWGWNGKGGSYFFCLWFLQLCSKISVQDCSYVVLG